MRVLHKDSLQRLAQEDVERLRELVEYRSKGEDEHFLNYLLSQGVIYSTTEKALDTRLRAIGLTLEDLNLHQKGLVENGWLFPVYDSSNRWMYWVNYSNRRESSKKYLNVVQQGNLDKMVLGMDTLPKALEINQLVWVEGVIDQYRLASYGIPTVATLGTTVTEYMQKLSKRVATNIIIPDNDGNEKTSIGKDFGTELRSQLTHARIFGLSYVKDIDECFSVMPEQFHWVIDQLKND